MLLNASGCLDALAAPDVARCLDAFVTKTVTPEPREGNEPERVAESDETYLLSAEGVDAVKVRDGQMDVKHLEQVDDGLELWKPVMKSPLPISAADARLSEV